MPTVNFPQTLELNLRKGRVIPFVGAGVSKAVLRQTNGRSLFPSWHELLLHAAHRLEQEQKNANAVLVRSLLEIDPPDLVDAARRAHEGLAGTWVDFLKEELDPHSQEARPESLALARSVWNLGSRLILTTNYDRVLLWACPEDQHNELRRWDIESKAEQSELLREGKVNKPTIWYLHGMIDNAANLILTPDGYRRLYTAGPDQEQHFEAALVTLRTLLASRSLLFIGFSLDDPSFGIELRGMNNVFEDSIGPHYALVKSSHVGRLHDLKLGVEPIPFSDFGGPLLDVLEQLGKIASENTSEANALGQPQTIPADLTSLVSAPIASYSPDNRPFFVPFRAKGDQVIGREAALQEVRSRLTGGKPTSIGQAAAFRGLGGLGKTQLAVEYAWKYEAEYPNGVIWLTADQDIAAQLTRLAVEAKWVAPESEHRTKLEVAEHRLRTYSGCLIIFDNLEDPASIEPYLPLPGANPHLLATSRNEQPLFTPITLDLLTETESLALLVQEADRPIQGAEEEEAATAVARELDGLPLALEMAGAYLLHRGLGWRQYKELLDRNPRAALRQSLLASFTRHEADIYATLKVQEGVFKEEPYLENILDVLTWSGAAPMGVPLLSALLKVNETDLLGALSLGEKLRLLEKQVAEARFGIHRLVRKVRQDELPLAQRRDWVETISQNLGDWFAANRRDFSDLSKFESEIDHLRAWQENSQEQSSPHASRLTWLQAYPPFHRGHFADSEVWIRRAFALFEEQQTKNKELEAWLWNDLATLQGKLGRYQEDIEYSQRSLDIRMEVFGDRHPDTAFSFSNIGLAYGHLGNAKAQLDYQLRGLELRSQVLGLHHPETIISFQNVCTAYKDTGEINKALDYGEKALEGFVNLFGGQSREVARLLGTIGTCYFSLGDHEKALSYFQSDLAITLTVLGDQHPDVATSLRSVGRGYIKLGDREKALEYLQQALGICLKSLGEQHPSTAATLREIGVVYEENGKAQIAYEYYKKALEILKGTGEQRLLTIEFSIDTARALSYLGRSQEAFSIVAPYLRDLPSDHPCMRRLRSLERKLLKKPLRPGFRQPSARSKKGKGKR